MEPHASPLYHCSGSGFFIVTPTVSHQLCPEELESGYRQLLCKFYYYYYQKKNIPSPSVLLVLFREHLMCFLSSYYSIPFCLLLVPINMAVVVLKPLQNWGFRLEATLWFCEALNSELKWSSYFYRNVSFHFVKKQFVTLLFPH